MALVVLNEAYRGKTTGEDLIAFFMIFVDSGRIPKYGVPNRILIVDTIAKACVGKIDKKIYASSIYPNVA